MQCTDNKKQLTKLAFMLKGSVMGAFSLTTFSNTSEKFMLVRLLSCINLLEVKQKEIKVKNGKCSFI